jgi:hypothetical protein
VFTDHLYNKPNLLNDWFVAGLKWRWRDFEFG